MSSKSERTTQYIIETVAPIFNKLGYAGTSFKDITDATGLSKGAIYGNFKGGKEELAIAAFNYTIRKVVGKLAEKINRVDTAVEKLKVLTDFYRKDYVRNALAVGGCPLVNVGVDSLHKQPALFARAKSVMLKLKNNTVQIIQDGIDSGELKSDINPETYANRIFAFTEGSIFMTATLNDPIYVMDAMDHIDEMVLKDLKK